MLAAGAWVAARPLLRLGTLNTAAVLVAALGVAALVAGLLLLLLVPAHLEDDARVLAAQLDAAGRGELSRETGGDADHLGPLAPVFAALGRTLSGLRTTLRPARQASRETATRADELVTQVATAHVAAQRTAEQGASLAEQAGRAGEAAGRCHDEARTLAEGVRLLDAQYRGLREQHEGVTMQVGRTRQEMAGLLGAMGGLAAGIEQGGAPLATLSGSVDQIREFVTLVRKMARQSKLLSLNAAMEAARAGEQGSGFGVVAGEVRRLARSSSDAADRTEKLLLQLEGAVEALSTGTRESTTVARASLVALEQMGAALDAALPVGVAAPVESPSAGLASVVAQLEQLASGLGELMQGTRDARLAGGAQVARLQDLSAAAHSLGRSAARTSAALHALRLGEGDPAVLPAPAPRGATPLVPQGARA